MRQDTTDPSPRDEPHPGRAACEPAPAPEPAPSPTPEPAPASAPGTTPARPARSGRPRSGRPRSVRPRAGGPPLTYVRLGEPPLRRLPQLFVGLALYGFSLAVMVRAALGVNPWSVLYEGLARHTSLSFGAISGLVGALVLLLWIPLRQRPTFGTVANIVVLAFSADLGLWLLPAHSTCPAGLSSSWAASC